MTTPFLQLLQSHVKLMVVNILPDLFLILFLFSVFASGLQAKP
jgi:hypothetical protein